MSHHVPTSRATYQHHVSHTIAHRIPTSRITYHISHTNIKYRISHTNITYHMSSHITYQNRASHTNITYHIPTSRITITHHIATSTTYNHISHTNITYQRISTSLEERISNRKAAKYSAGKFSYEKLASNASIKNQGTTWLQSERKIQSNKSRGKLVSGNKIVLQATDGFVPTSL